MSRKVFTYLRPLARSYNVNILVREERTGKLWAGKISRSLQEKGVYFTDLNNRACLAERLADLIGVPLVPSRIVSTKIISGFDATDVSDRISDEAYLTPLAGDPLPVFLEQHRITDIRNSEAILANVVFNAWVGNHDRKDGDYIIGKDAMVSFIDYQLCGPGFLGQPYAAIGAYAEAYTIDQPEDIGWCIGGPRLLAFVRTAGFSYSDFEPAIRQVVSVSQRAIRAAVVGLTFTNEKGLRLPQHHVELFFRWRQAGLAEAIQKWVAAGYPRGKRPLDPAHGDSIYADANS